jgi:MFS family permease
LSGLRNIRELFAREPRARLFFAALAQSSLGTGAAYVALLLVAFDRFHSAWAITLVLLADFVPSMLFGPILGAAADRWSRKGCLIAADALRAATFIGIALISSFGVTVLLAFLAGAGNALFKPAALAAMPSLVDDERVPAATSVFGAVVDAGFTVGPALAAVALLAFSPEDVLFVNGLTFVVSAAALATMSFGQVPHEPGVGAGLGALWREAREGIAVSARLAGIRVVILASAIALLGAGFFNVAELLFAKQNLDAGDAGYSALVALFGAGFIVGSLTGAAGGELLRLKHRYIGGLAILGAGFVACGLAPSLASALATFAIAGFGNGLLVVHERLLIQGVVSIDLQARVFAVTDTVVAWGFGIAFVGAGALIALTGAREVILVAGACGLAAALWAAVALRGQWRTGPPVVVEEPAAATIAAGEIEVETGRFGIG